ncbi:MAG: hypothetical protein ABI613_04900 [Gemmatimonadota bacterium]
MSEAKQAQKRERAAQFPFGGPLAEVSSPAYGPLDIQFESAFDCATYIVTAEKLPTKNAKKYKELMEYLSSTTGCDDEEVIAHGNKVRGLLYFSLESLRNKGTVVGKEKVKYPMPKVRPAF